MLCFVATVAMDTAHHRELMLSANSIILCLWSAVFCVKGHQMTLQNHWCERHTFKLPDLKSVKVKSFKKETTPGVCAAAKVLNSKHANTHCSNSCFSRWSRPVRKREDSLHGVTAGDHAIPRRWLGGTCSARRCWWLAGGAMVPRRTAASGLRIVPLTPPASRQRFWAIQSSARPCSEGAKLFGLPGVLFGLWIKWSPGLGAGATSCPCLDSRGSYSFPS